MTDNDQITQLTAKMEEVLDRGKIDAIAAPNLILLLADLHDADPVTALAAIRDNEPITDKFTQLISDILETSQSNIQRSIMDLIEVLTIDRQIAALTDAD